MKRENHSTQLPNILFITILLLFCMMFLRIGSMNAFAEETDPLSNSTQETTEVTSNPIGELNQTKTDQQKTNETTISTDLSQEENKADPKNATITEESENTGTDVTKDVKENVAQSNVKSVPRKAPAAEDNVATLNGVSYKTVQAAINAAIANDTIIVQKDIDEQLTIDKVITIDLNQHRYTCSNPQQRSSQYAKKYAIEVANNIIPTIKNGTIYGITQGIIYGGGINLDHLIFEGNKDTILINISNYAANETFDIDNVTFINNNAGLIKIGYNKDYTISNCTFKNNQGDHTSVTANSVLSLGGNGTAAISNSTFQNNSGFQYIVYGGNMNYSKCTLNGNDAGDIIDGHSLTFNDCVIENNNASQTTVRSSNDWNVASITVLKNTVIKNNSSTSAYSTDAAGLRSNYYGTTLENSAVYNNTSNSGRNDFNFWADNYSGSVPDYYVTYENLKNFSHIDLKEMKDPTAPDKDFSNYTINTNGKVFEAVPIYEAEINGKKYKKFMDALAAAQNGDIIKVIVTNDAGESAALTAQDDQGFIQISKAITIDLNGRDLYSTNGIWIWGNGNLTFMNTSETSSTIRCGISVADSNSVLTLASNVDAFTWINPNNSANVTFSGQHNDTLWVRYNDEHNQGSIIIPAIINVKDIVMNNGKIYIQLANIDAINSFLENINDFAIINGGTENLLSNIEIGGLTNPLVKLILRDGKVYIHKDVGNVVYLNGADGSDDNDGSTKNTAVRTFAKAKELAVYLFNQNSNRSNNAISDSMYKVWIYIIGTVNVNDNQTWSFDENTEDRMILMREPDFNGYLVSVSGKDAILTLKNITMDGNIYASPSKSLIEVTNNGALNIEDGTILQNNKLSIGAQVYDAVGGAIYATNATINMNGGTIQNNQASIGGGIALQGSVLNMTGGTIQNNRAINGTEIIRGNRRNGLAFASGGGIGAFTSHPDDEAVTTINLKGGTICNNYSNETGGGIGLGYQMESGSIIFNMTGGTISGNTAGSSGGGIYIQETRKGRRNEANIYAGQIINNVMDASGIGNKHFGGGGIYVNGINAENADIQNGVLNLYSAIITDNEAAADGGGYAGCPTTITDIEDNSVVIFQNKANSGKDIYILSQTSYGNYGGEPIYSIAKIMLGGKLYYWIYDDGTDVHLDTLKGILHNSGSGAVVLALNNDAAVDDIAKYLATVIISGNYSKTCGGGIGSNGTIHTYPGVLPKTSVNVTKQWNDDEDQYKNRPEMITVHLLADGEDTGHTLVLNKDNQWKGVFTDLALLNDKGERVVYTISEDTVTGYKKAIIVEDPVTINVYTEKMSENKGNDSITVHLLADGEDTGKTLILNKENQWRASFENLTLLNDEGNGIVYTISGDNTDCYKVIAQSYTVINDPAEISISGTKVWNDNNDPNRPTSITIDLIKVKDNVRMIVERQTIEADAAGNWKFVFHGLHEYENGVPVVYTIEEEKIPGYTSTISGDMEHGFVITNTLVPKEEKKEAPKPSSDKQIAETSYQKPVESESTSSVQTGVTSNVFMYMMTSILSIGYCAAWLKRRG